jgi:class 3 adenylate cyclase
VTAASSRLRVWQRLDVRLGGFFALVTLLAVAAVGTVVYARQQRELEDTVGTQLLNIARTASLLVDPAAHAEAQRIGGARSPAYDRVRRALAAVQREVLLPTPIVTLTDFDAARRTARVVVTGGDGPGAGATLTIAPEVVEPLTWTLEDGVARYTRIYAGQNGMWISAIAPIVDGQGRTTAVLDVDYPVDVYLDRLDALRRTVIEASMVGAVAALLVGFVLARRITRPITALTSASARITGGDLPPALPVRSADEVGRLTRAFNEMIDGLRQRDFIRSAFGRYVSPEVAQTLLESPEGLRLGGDKREVTILMSDLRGYTAFAERGEPEHVMAVLNEYLGRMAEIVIAHGGTINEFIGDAIFAVFGAPIAHPDHAERAAATALAMQRAIEEVNAAQAARGIPRFDMGIGINTGEAVVGNIGSEQRAKYSVVGSAVNVAARVESATVGGQIYLTSATLERVRDLAEVEGPVVLEVKGLSEPLALYELRALSGRFAQRLPDSANDPGPEAEVTIPVVCRVVEGKVVRQEPVSGVVRRVGRRRLDAALDAALVPLTNVRLRLTYPALGRESSDLYGKVVACEERDGVRLTRIHLTSVDARDRDVLDALVQ